MYTETELQDLREVYDCVEIERMKEQDVNLLLIEILEFTKELYQNVVTLRSEVNEKDLELQLSKNKDMAQYQTPYEDLYSDINMSFYDMPAYNRFKKIFKKFGY